MSPKALSGKEGLSYVPTGKESLLCYLSRGEQCFRNWQLIIFVVAGGSNAALRFSELGAGWTYTERQSPSQKAASLRRLER